MGWTAGTGVRRPVPLTHPDVRMDDQAERQHAVQDRVRTRARRRRRANHGDQTRAEEPLERPVVRAVRARRLRELGGVVDRALVDRCRPCVRIPCNVCTFQSRIGIRFTS